METKITVTPQFARDFALVAAHFKCSPSEIQDMKTAVLADLASATQSFRLMADEIEGGAI